MKRKVGEPFDDVALEKLAGNILAQLARRDIWITDVEIYEYSKKKITFKETKGGILVKNKKFSVDNESNSLVVQDIMEAAPPQQQPSAMIPAPSHVQHPHELIPRQRPQQAQQAPPPANNRAPKKWLLYQPSDRVLIKKYIVERGYRFTIEKKYPVLAESMNPNGIGLQIRTLDDNNRDAVVPDELFVPCDQHLIAAEAGFAAPPLRGGSNGDGLTWEGVVSDRDVPTLR